MTDPVPSKESLLDAMPCAHPWGSVATCFDSSTGIRTTVCSKCDQELDRTTQRPSKDQVWPSNERVGFLIDYWTAKLGSHRRWPEGQGLQAELMGLIYADTIAAMESLDRLRTALRGIQSCSTCSACRGAATLALRDRCAPIERRVPGEPPMTPSERLRRVAFELSDIATNCPRELNRSEMAKIAARMLSASAHVELGQRAAQPPGDGA